MNLRGVNFMNFYGKNKSKKLEKIISLSLALGFMVPSLSFAAPNPSQKVNGTVVNFGDDYQIVGTTGNSALAVYSAGSAIFGNNANIYFGDYAATVYLAENNSRVIMGNGAIITKDGDGSAIRSDNGSNIEVKIGNNAVITASGSDHSYGVHSYAGNAQFTFGTGTKISVESTGEAKGIYVDDFGAADMKGKTISFEANSEIKAEGAKVAAVDIKSEDTTFTMKDGGKITAVSNAVSNNTAYGIFALKDNTNITLGDNIEFNITGAPGGASAGNGILLDGAGSKATIGNNAKFTLTGESMTAVSAQGKGSITIGDDLEVKVTGTTVNGVFASYGQNNLLAIGERANIQINGKWATGVGSSYGGTVTLKNDAYIYTNGEGAAAVAATASPTVEQNAKITVGDNLEAYAIGDGSLGIKSQGKGTLVTIGDNLDLTVSGGYSSSATRYTSGLYASEGGTLNIGVDATIDAKGQSVAGVRAATGGSINVDTDSIVKVEGTSAAGIDSRNANTNIIVKDNLDLTVKGTTSIGVYSYYYGQVNIKDEAIISVTGDGATGVYAMYNGGFINFGNDLDLSVSGTNSIGLYAYGTSAYPGSKITVGDDASIDVKGYIGAGSTYGNVELGERNYIEVTQAGAMGLYSYTAGKITAQEDFEIKVSGDGSYGVYASDGGQVEVDKNATVTVTGKYGIYAGTNSNVEFEENAAITVTGNSSYGARTSRGTITISDDSTLSVNGNGSYGLYTSNGNINVSNTDISIEGTDNVGIYSTGASGLAKVDGGSLTVEHGWHMQTATTGQIQVSDISIGNADNMNLLVSASSGNVLATDSILTGHILHTAENAGTLALTLQGESVLTGTANSNDDQGKIDIIMNGNRWNVLGNSNTRGILNTGTNGFVDMTADDRDNPFSTLTVENLTGTGTFLMDIDGSQVDQTDKVIVTDTFTGTQVISLKEINGLDSDLSIGQKAKGTVLASVKNNDGEFVADDYEGSLYWERYTLEQKYNEDSQYTDWYLGAVNVLNPEDKPTTTVEGGAAAGALAFHMWRDNDKLMQRMGDLRKNGEKEKGFWFRMKRGQLGRDGNFGFENQFNHYEMGYDKIIAKNDSYTRYGGISLGYTDGTSSYKNGYGDATDKALSMYVTQIGNKGHYMDLVFKINRIDTDYTLYDSNQKRINGDFQNKGVSLSTEYGYKKELSNNGWYIEPQVQLKIGHLAGDDYTSNDIKISQKDATSVLGRVGFNLGKDMGKNSQFYVKANLLHEFCGDYDVTMRDKFDNKLKIEQDFSDTWFEYGLGFTFKTGSNNHIYFDVERMAGGDFDKDWQWNAGARWTF
ncbi:autotransporter outer membrane beta-barrel domain-containing protein [Selenomonadales bacterium OttesenSCG-928-I06]|nr:autotransporter outer membrane beta-barrel domain-containing protein [Selenomonadales bacterium OttesenSCG-928-I06]